MKNNLLSLGTLFILLLATYPVAAYSKPLPLPKGCELVSRASEVSATSPQLSPIFPPIQLEIYTPFAPTVFTAGGYNYLMYELHLQNYTDSPMALRGIEIFDATDLGSAPILSLFDSDFFKTLVPIGVDAIDADHPLGAGRRVVGFVCLAFDKQRSVPTQLRHDIVMSDSVVVKGPPVGTSNGEAKVLSSPVSGGDWMAVSGLHFSAHHRSGLFVAGGLAQISRRYAVDWKRIRDGVFFSGDALDVRSYYAYGEEVLAVADGTVVIAVDGLPDNTPRTAAGFETAVPITMETIAGNWIVLDLGDGQFAHYAHLKQGSLRVKTGDQVQRGETLALIGNSGDAREPHLHFQIASSADILASEGVPYMIEHFRIKDADGRWKNRINEFPLDNAVIDFPHAEESPSVPR